MPGDACPDLVHVQLACPGDQLLQRGCPAAPRAGRKGRRHPESPSASGSRRCPARRPASAAPQCRPCRTPRQHGALRRARRQGRTSGTARTMRPRNQPAPSYHRSSRRQSSLRSAQPWPRKPLYVSANNTRRGMPRQPAGGSRHFRQAGAAPATSGRRRGPVPSRAGGLTPAWDARGGIWPAGGPCRGVGCHGYRWEYMETVPQSARQAVRGRRETAGMSTIAASAVQVVAADIPALGDCSYLGHDGSSALVIDGRAARPPLLSVPGSSGSRARFGWMFAGNGASRAGTRPAPGLSRSVGCRTGSVGLPPRRTVITAGLARRAAVSVAGGMRARPRVAASGVRRGQAA